MFFWGPIKTFEQLEGFQTKEATNICQGRPNCCAVNVHLNLDLDTFYMQNQWLNWLKALDEQCEHSYAFIHLTDNKKRKTCRSDRTDNDVIYLKCAGQLCFMRGKQTKTRTHKKTMKLQTKRFYNTAQVFIKFLQTLNTQHEIKVNKTKILCPFSLMEK